MTAKRKMTIYVPEDVAKQIEAESARVERSTSWIVEYAWRAAHKRVQLVPRAGMPVNAQTSEEEACRRQAAIFQMMEDLEFVDVQTSEKETEQS